MDISEVYELVAESDLETALEAIWEIEDQENKSDICDEREFFNNHFIVGRIG